MTGLHLDPKEARSRQGALPADVGRGQLNNLRYGRGLLTVLLVASLVWSLLQVDWEDGILRTGGLDTLLDMLTGVAQPDLSVGTLGRVLAATWTTIVYAVASMTVALFLGLPIGVWASGVLASSPLRRKMMTLSGRGVLAAMRAIHELVWAWLFVAAIGLTPFAVIFAIGIAYAGILGRIYADLLNDVPAGPLRALRATGANSATQLAYGRAPMAMPDIIAYSFYRFECALRASAIMGFVGLGGLGFEMQIALADLDFQAVGTSLLALVLLVLVVEVWSSQVRRRIV